MICPSLTISGNKRHVTAEREGDEAVLYVGSFAIRGNPGMLADVCLDGLMALHTLPPPIVPDEEYLDRYTDATPA